MWRTLVFVALLACSGDEEPRDPLDTGRTPCEESCFTTEMRPCLANCEVACEPGDARCLDVCSGDCIGAYDRCVAAICDE